jgi:phosphate starvation-inducible PhoH-like protein
MKKFLTRIGQVSKAIVTETPPRSIAQAQRIGLLHALKLLTGVEGLHFAYLNTRDVVRNPLIKKIIEAYEREDE